MFNESVLVLATKALEPKAFQDAVEQCERDSSLCERRPAGVRAAKDRDLDNLLTDALDVALRPGSYLSLAGRES